MTGIAPGATIGILGGGQLGRMLALAAARLGYRSHIFCPEADPPAGQVTPLATRADYADRDAVAAFARRVDVVTFEFENVPLVAAETAAAIVPVRPSAQVLAIAQDRIAEKRFVNACGVATAPWRAVTGPGEGAAAGPTILKTARLGYDGKGQLRLPPGGDVDAAWRALGGVPCVLEDVVDFAREVSVVIARGIGGAMAAYVPVENRHSDGILRRTVVPAPVVPATAEAALAVTERLAERLDLVGVLAVEMFVTRDGGVLVNELAPRPHNSGHWTIDAAATSQFEQTVRAICGLPLGDPAALADATMDNLIGSEIDAWPALVAEPGARLHLYGKGEARPGRKMGHVTRLAPRA